MTKIYLHSHLFYPDELAGAALFTDLALFLKEQGHDVRVLCTFSYYPAWKLREEDVGVVARDEVWNGIPVQRLAMYVPAQPTGSKRLLSDLSFLLSILRRGKFSEWTPDVILAASPMFSQCLTQRFIYLGKRVPRMIVVQDFVVDAALELGILKVPFIGTPLRWLERWTYRSATTLSTISDRMLGKLREIVGEGRRLRMIPNWIHQSLADEVGRQRRTGEWERSGVLLYSGNLGIKQGLPHFLESFMAAKSDWTMQIRGGGIQLDQLRASIAGNEHVEFGGVRSEADYVTALMSCAACLVTQMPGVGANFLPSKLLPALAAGTPVLAVCEADSPLGLEVGRGGFGEIVEPGDVEGLRELLSRWEREPHILIELGSKALEWAENYRRDRILAMYESELLLLAGEGENTNTGSRAEAQRRGG